MFKAKITMPTPLSSDQLEEAQKKVVESGLDPKEIQVKFDKSYTKVELIIL
jgi:F0F1-type ATP synthase delta subunit